MSKIKKVPQRTCIGCRQIRSKKEMLRIVRTPEGSIEVDTTGKRSGRGAYICPNSECFREAIRGRSLANALGATVSHDVIERISKVLEEEARKSSPSPV
jgi:predicted RNA-binding protein YlxR (DUF448 family)